MASDVIYAFFDLEDGGRWAFVRLDGEPVEGYPLDIEPGRVLFCRGGPLAPEEPEWLDFASIRPDSLSYFSRALGRWVSFT